jgi:hypothetical protein
MKEKLKLENKNSLYKEMLSKVREKSKEQALKRSEISNEEYNPRTQKKDNFKKQQLLSPSRSNYSNLGLMSSQYQELQVSSNINNLEIMSTRNKNKDSFQFIKNPPHNQKDFEDEDNLISILNSSGQNLKHIINNRSKVPLKESNIEVKSNFYDENLFDLIDDMEREEKFQKTSNIHLPKQGLIHETSNQKNKLDEQKNNLNYEIQKE